MKNVAYITTPSGMTLFLSGKPYKISKASPLYEKVLNLFDDQAGAEFIEAEIEKFVKREDIKEAGFAEGSYKGEVLHPVLAAKLESIRDSGAPVDGLVEFFNRLNQNPSATSVEELYDFLSYRELPITEDGYFLAYKGVNADYWSVRGNPSTQVASQTKVDSEGHCYNGIGEKVFVKYRNQVDDKRNNGCSFGLHVGSLDYARGWGRKVVVVKVDPADVVSVPSDCNCQKLRTEGYEVISDFKEEIVAPVVGAKGEVANSSNKFTERVKSYLNKKTEEGEEVVAISKIQSIFSPEWPSKVKVQSALQDLGLAFNDKVVYL